MTAAPDKERSVGKDRLHLHCDQERSVRRKPNLLEVFIFQVKLNRLAQVLHRFVEHDALGYDRQIHTLGDIAELIPG